MALLNGEGLAVLWNRVLRLFDRTQAADLGAADRIVITDHLGKIGTEKDFSVRTSETVYYETEAQDGDSRYRQMPQDAGVLFVESGTNQMETLGPLDQVMVEVNGETAVLARRYYDRPAYDRTYVLFGNTRYTGFGTPKLGDQTDTGEPYLLFAQSSLLGLCLPDAVTGTLRVLWKDAFLTVPSDAAEDLDVLNLHFFRTNAPMISGSGSGSVQQSGSAAAIGAGDAAVNDGTASGGYAFAANSGAAAGSYAAAFGWGTRAEAAQAFAEGSETIAGARNAHAEGDSSTASGVCAHAQGRGTIASGECQTVSGRFNIENTEMCEIVGNGEAGARSNGRTLDWSGNEWLQGTLEAEAVLLREGTKVYRLSVLNGSLSITEVT